MTTASQWQDGIRRCGWFYGNQPVGVRRPTVICRTATDSGLDTRCRGSALNLPSKRSLRLSHPTVRVETAGGRRKTVPRRLRIVYADASWRKKAVSGCTGTADSRAPRLLELVWTAKAGSRSSDQKDPQEGEQSLICRPGKRRK